MVVVGNHSNTSVWTIVDDFYTDVTLIRIAQVTCALQVSSENLQILLLSPWGVCHTNRIGWFNMKWTFHKLNTWKQFSIGQQTVTDIVFPIPRTILIDERLKKLRVKQGDDFSLLLHCRTSIFLNITDHICGESYFSNLRIKKRRPLYIN